MCFPEESYDYDAMCKNSIFIGAYDGDICIGLAIMQHAFFEYMYDLKVNEEVAIGKILMLSPTFPPP